jgi:hypothetical protein
VTVGDGCVTGAGAGVGEGESGFASATSSLRGVRSERERVAFVGSERDDATADGVDDDEGAAAGFKRAKKLPNFA